MAGQNDRAREPAVAGTFYPADAAQCAALARQYIGSASPAEGPTRAWRGGVVPHAGWVCSGAIAGETIGTIAAGSREVDLVVVFGAIHTPIPTDRAVLDSYAAWNLPGEVFEVSRDLRKRLDEIGELFRTDDRFHNREHAVEVELPLIRAAWPEAGIVPIEVPADASAIEVGRAVAKFVASSSRNAIFLASSDLTHYGPAYGFAPAGIGESAMKWSKANDAPLLEDVVHLRVESIVPRVREMHSACGPGAIAAMLAACREFGATRGELLAHATSYETLAAVAPQPPENAVGYAAIVVG